MSGFELVPVDGGAPVHLPPGETMLGRGPFLGVSDKRVSRHHGLLQNLSGQLHIKPMHLNPCFIQSSLTDDPQPMRKGSWFPLRDGDFISLLPGKLIYKVVALGAGEHIPRNNEMFEEEKKGEKECSSSPDPYEEPALPKRLDREQTPPHKEPMSAVLFNEEEEEEEEEEKEKEGPNGRLNQEDVTPKEEEEEHCSNSGMKKRVLPAWMMAVAATPSGSSSSPKVQSSVKVSKAPAAAKRTTPTANVSSEEVGLSEEEEENPRKRRRKAPDITDSKKEDRKRKDKRQEPKQAESVGSNGGSSSVSTRLRTPCPYGKDCYRKNPVHFQECSHPGDSDYEEENENVEDVADRPLCPYGTDCYRTNPLHRKEYKHTRTRARPRTVPKKSQVDDEDEDEYDDSFIDDDSDDMGGDSDYVPPDSDDSSKEDIRRLQKEAQVFLWRK